MPQIATAYAVTATNQDPSHRGSFFVPAESAVLMAGFLRRGDRAVGYPCRGFKERRHMERVPFPKDVDAPQRFLLWTMDQFIPFAVFLGVGIFIHALFTCIALGIAVSYLFTRWRDSSQDGFLMHLAYWHGVMSQDKVRCCIPSFVRRIFPT